MTVNLNDEGEPWVPFWFETNSAWGHAVNRERWEEIRANWEKGAHGMKRDHVYNMKNSVYNVDGELPSFGSRSEHIGGKTSLKQFFEENGMKLK